MRPSLSTINHIIFPRLVSEPTFTNLLLKYVTVAFKNTCKMKQWVHLNPTEASSGAFNLGFT